MPKEFKFEELREAPLVVDAIYRGGTKKNFSDEVLHHLFDFGTGKSIGISGGFRVRKNKNGEYQFVVLFTTMAEIEWPDFLDKETGVFRYYGDNREPGKGLHDTKPKGNLFLHKIFTWLNEPENRWRIPPILVFRGFPDTRDVQFLGLAVPGVRDLSSEEDLVAFWRTKESRRFQNYRAYFSILDVNGDHPLKEWICERQKDNPDADELAPKAWKAFQAKGRDGIKPLMSKTGIEYPSKNSQLPDSDRGREIIDKIRDYFNEYPQGFEHCAVDIVMMMDPNFYSFNVTQPWRDGGRDAIGQYRIGPLDGNSNLFVDCSLEAKLYTERSVGVKEVSRLISRIRYRQFGILVTTSYIDKQAFLEIKEDKHPIIMLTGRDIANVIMRNVEDVDTWLSKYPKVVGEYP